jgi:hypothetical protein
VVTEETYQDGQVIFQRRHLWRLDLHRAFPAKWKSSGGPGQAHRGGYAEAGGPVRAGQLRVTNSPGRPGRGPWARSSVGVYDRSFLIRSTTSAVRLRAIFDALARRLRKMTMVATNLAGRKSETPGPKPGSHLQDPRGIRQGLFHQHRPGGAVCPHRPGAGYRHGNPPAILPARRQPSHRVNARVAWKSGEPDTGRRRRIRHVSPADRTRVEFLSALRVK